MAEGGPLLELSGVVKDYESPDRAAPVRVLDGVDLRVDPGDSVAVIGPSGSGKSTLLQIIGTLDRATTGEVILNGRNVTRAKEDELAFLRNHQIGFVFQFHYLLPQCSVFENVLVPTLADKSSDDGGERAEDRAKRLLERVGLGPRLGHRPGQLSGGERQRVAVVRALINRPKLLLADEPTGSLDHASAGQLADLLVDLNREEKVSLILVTHALDLAHRMKKVFELKDGRINQVLPGT